MWLSLFAPGRAEGTVDTEALALEAKNSGLPLDVSRATALWGGWLRGCEALTLMQISGSDIEDAVDSKHASDLTQAHLIQTLSAIGREWIDFYFLRSRRALEEFQLSGVLEALEAARQEGHVRFFGLHCEGRAAASIANWQLHDAFEVVCIDGDSEQHEELARIAAGRRVGVLKRVGKPGAAPIEDNQIALAPVRVAEDVRRIA
ncbi:MAG TPA: hypothetical protein VG944_03725 [Fimbriimonas sp.]|nr:hypothetical protein [Fimbriimonas sp.]